MALRFAFDLGTSSLGWAVFEVEIGSPVNLVALGSHIFGSGEAGAGREPNGDSKAKNAAMPAPCAKDMTGECNAMAMF